MPEKETQLDVHGYVRMCVFVGTRLCVCRDMCLLVLRVCMCVYISVFTCMCIFCFYVWCLCVLMYALVYVCVCVWKEPWGHLTSLDRIHWIFFTLSHIYHFVRVHVCHRHIWKSVLSLSM